MPGRAIDRVLSQHHNVEDMADQGAAHPEARCLNIPSRRRKRIVPAHYVQQHFGMSSSLASVIEEEIRPSVIFRKVTSGFRQLADPMSVPVIDPVSW
jgi:hypothetical protein